MPLSFAAVGFGACSANVVIQRLQNFPEPD